MKELTIKISGPHPKDVMVFCGETPIGSLAEISFHSNVNSKNNHLKIESAISQDNVLYKLVTECPFIDVYGPAKEWKQLELF